LSREFQDRLLRRARRAGLSIDADLKSRLEIYFRLLAQWNSKVNLTGFELHDPSPEAIDKLLIEPLLAAKFIPSTATRVIDIGSGGGSPAIPMLLAVPRLLMRLVESKTRKCVFLREVLRALDVRSSEVVTARFEELLARPELHEAHEVLTVRAVRIESRVLMNLQAFVRPSGQLFLFRSGTNGDFPMLIPPLSVHGTHFLLDAQGSALLVLEKQPVGRPNR
jgi:16S rRNA (guanine527-N7)-methyltransferase